MVSSTAGSHRSHCFFVLYETTKHDTIWSFCSLIWRETDQEIWHETRKIKSTGVSSLVKCHNLQIKEWCDNWINDPLMTRVCWEYKHSCAATIYFFFNKCYTPQNTLCSLQGNMCLFNILCFFCSKEKPANLQPPYILCTVGMFCRIDGGAPLKECDWVIKPGWTEHTAEYPSFCSCGSVDTGSPPSSRNISHECVEATTQLQRTHRK